MAINTHGLKMKGIKAAVGEIPTGGYYSGEYAEVFYDKASGEVWANYQCSLGQNTWTVYDDRDVIKIGNYSKKTTMQQLADDIYETVSFNNRIACDW